MQFSTQSDLFDTEVKPTKSVSFPRNYSAARKEAEAEKEIPVTLSCRQHYNHVGRNKFPLEENKKSAVERPFFPVHQEKAKNWFSGEEGVESSPRLETNKWKKQVFVSHLRHHPCLKIVCICVSGVCTHSSNKQELA